MRAYWSTTCLSLAASIMGTDPVLVVYTGNTCRDYGYSRIVCPRRKWGLLTVLNLLMGKWKFWVKPSHAVEMFFSSRCHTRAIAAWGILHTDLPAFAADDKLLLSSLCGCCFPMILLKREAKTVWKDFLNCGFQQGHSRKIVYPPLWMPEVRQSKCQLNPSRKKQESS